MRRLGAWLALAASAGCGGGAKPATVFVLAERAPEGLDPHTSGMIHQTRNLLANVYEGLVGFDTQMALVPALALSWSNPNDDTWEFRLRPGVRFQCGGVLEPQDVVFSIERARDHEASVLRAAAATVAAVELAGPLAVRVRTKEPDAGLLHRLRDVVIVSRRAVQSGGEAAFAKASCGTGPYVVSPGEAGAMTLERFPGHWASAPAVPRVVFLPYAYGDPAVEKLVLKGAPLMFYTRPSRGLYQRAVQEAVPHRWPRPGISYLGFDLKGNPTAGVRLADGRPRNPFLDVRVREAVARALDLTGLARVAEGEDGLLPSQLVAPFVFGFEPSLPAPHRDLAAARRLLAEAGYPQGFEVDLDVRALMDVYGPAIAEGLAPVGIRVMPRILGEQEFFARLEAGQSSLYVLRFTCRTGDAQEFYDAWIHSRDAQRGYGLSNYSYAVNPIPGLDVEIEAARRELDSSRRLVKLQAVMRRAMAARLALPLLAPQGLTFVSSSLEWTPRNDGFWLMNEVRWAKGR